MILIRSIYITAIGWCLFLFILLLMSSYPDIFHFHKDGWSDDRIFWMVAFPLLLACLGIAYRFIRQEEQK